MLISRKKNVLTDKINYLFNTTPLVSQLSLYIISPPFDCSTKQTLSKLSKTMYSTSSTSPELLQDFLANFHTRKLLLYYKPVNHTSVTAAPPPYSQSANLDKNVFMVLSVLLCGVICSLGLNFIVRCALRCSPREGTESNDNPPAAAAVNRGIELKALKTFPVVNYSAEMNLNLPGMDTECVICLSEFEPGIA
ncbi:hypothetical protein PTKIN_Ptkin08bG0166700 [Pterospermum kingtungense]